MTHANHALLLGGIDRQVVGWVCAPGGFTTDFLFFDPELTYDHAVVEEKIQRSLELRPGLTLQPYIPTNRLQTWLLSNWSSALRYPNKWSLELTSSYLSIYQRSGVIGVPSAVSDLSIYSSFMDAYHATVEQLKEAFYVKLGVAEGFEHDIKPYLPVPNL